jgi:hypothetical protein
LVRKTQQVQIARKSICGHFHREPLLLYLNIPRKGTKQPEISLVRKRDNEPGEGGQRPAR